MLPQPRPKLIGVFGTPSTLTYWGIHIVRTIAGVVQGDYEFAHGHYRAEFADAQARSGGERPTICVSDCPEVGVSSLFIGSGSPIIVFVEEPAAIIDDLMASGAVDGVGALRLAARSLCALQPLLEAPGAIILRKTCLDRDVREVFGDVLTALNLGTTSDQRADIDRLLSLPADGATPMTVRDHIIRHFPTFGERQSDESMPGALPVHTIAKVYDGLVTGDDIEQAEWPSSIFSSGDKIGDFVDGPNELIGPARILVYGPYMHLTRGEWSSYVELEVSGNASGNQLKVDVVCGGDTKASVLAELPVMGRYSLSMPFTIREPLEPIELRFQIECGAIEGRFLLSKVVMTRLASASAAPRQLAAG